VYIVNVHRDVVRVGVKIFKAFHALILQALASEYSPANVHKVHNVHHQSVAGSSSEDFASPPSGGIP
jgi:hypothetical protein